MLRILSVLLVILVPTLGIAATLRVPTQYSDIQSAIDAAQPGDTIEVSQGTYTGSGNRDLDLGGKSLALVGTGEPGTVIIDCEGLGYGFNIDDGEDERTLIRGFVITNGVGFNGAGILIERSTATIEDCHINNCVAGNNGGGIFISQYNHEPVHIIDCIIRDNEAGLFGGGLMVLEAEVEIEYSVFDSNAANGFDGGGGAMYDDDAIRVTLDHCTLVENTSSDGANAIAFEGNTMLRNTLTAGNGGYLQDNTLPFMGTEFDPFSFNCCNVYEELNEDINSITLVNGNINENPMFCAEYLRVSHYSPCLTTFCGQIGAYGEGCSYVLPGTAEIVGVQDVGNDQGGSIRLTWIPPSDDPSVTEEYAIFRRIDAYKTVPSGDWDFITTVPAVGMTEYNAIVPTLCDSTISGGLCQSVFFIRSLTGDPVVFFDSPPDSGHSVDNLAPTVPGGLLMGGDLTLNWDEAPDVDFNYFTVYGSSQEQLDGMAVVIGHTTGTSLDLSGQTHAYFHLTATDFSGNESAAASLESVSDVPGSFLESCLHGAVPNPFNPTTKISFELARAGYARLSVYDAAGRLIVTLVDANRKAGIYEVIWDGCDDTGRMSSAGVYLYRLETQDFMDTKRVTLIK